MKIARKLMKELGSILVVVSYAKKSTHISALLQGRDTCLAILTVKELCSVEGTHSRGKGAEGRGDGIMS